MKLVKLADPRIDMRNDNGVSKEVRRRRGIFECPACLQHITLIYSQGMKQKTCGIECTFKSGCTTHGKARTPLYVCWINIRERCDNVKSRAYKYCGAKGITYPDKWKTFAGFEEDMGKMYVEGLILKRLDRRLNYTVQNCMWVVNPNCKMKIKGKGKGRSRRISQSTLDGVPVKNYSSITEASKQTGANFRSIGRVLAGDRNHTHQFIWKYL